MPSNPETILITGATGFVGSKLLAAMADDDCELRVIVRDADKLPDPHGASVVEGDVDDAHALTDALRGCRCAYYLVHSMEPGDDDYAALDRKLAEGFVAAADDAGLERIVYLGGVESDGEDSEHLESRHEVQHILGDGSADLVALRASMVIGARSDSFRTLAQIVDRLPVLALPSWRETRTQPVAIDDVVAALRAARDVAPGSYAIAGPDELTIAEITQIIADLQEHNRPALKLPFSSAKLEGAVASAVTDASPEVLEPLMAGLHEDLVVEDNQLQPVFGVAPTPFRDAARDALEQMAAED